MEIGVTASNVVPSVPLETLNVHVLAVRTHPALPLKKRKEWMNVVVTLLAHVSVAVPQPPFVTVIPSLLLHWRIVFHSETSKSMRNGLRLIDG
jgi:hypothetical protein